MIDVVMITVVMAATGWSHLSGAAAHDAIATKALRIEPLEGVQDELRLDLSIYETTAGYSPANAQPIAVMVPAGVIQPKQILLFLHGFRGVCPTTTATLEQIEADWRLTQQMIGGGAAGSVMLFPASQGKCATCGRNSKSPTEPWQKRRPAPARLILRQLGDGRGNIPADAVF